MKRQKSSLNQIKTLTEVNPKLYRVPSEWREQIDRYKYCNVLVRSFILSTIHRSIFLCIVDSSTILCIVSTIWVWYKYVHVWCIDVSLRYIKSGKYCNLSYCFTLGDNEWIRKIFNNQNIGYCWLGLNRLDKDMWYDNWTGKTVTRCDRDKTCS